jgi:hypothetical protein
VIYHWAFFMGPQFKPFAGQGKFTPLNSAACCQSSLVLMAVCTEPAEIHLISEPRFLGQAGKAA